VVAVFLISFVLVCCSLGSDSSYILSKYSSKKISLIDAYLYLLNSINLYVLTWV